MSNPPPLVPVDPAAEKIKALQYLFDVARSASAPAAVHEQTRAYAQYLADSFAPAGAVDTNPVITAAQAREKAVTESVETVKEKVTRATDAVVT